MRNSSSASLNQLSPANDPEGKRAKYVRIPLASSGFFSFSAFSLPETMHPPCKPRCTPGHQRPAGKLYCAAPVTCSLSFLRLQIILSGDLFLLKISISPSSSWQPDRAKQQILSSEPVHPSVQTPLPRLPAPGSLWRVSLSRLR